MTGPKCDYGPVISIRPISILRSHPFNARSFLKAADIVSTLAGLVF